jgi:hypothetical protein
MKQVLFTVFLAFYVFFPSVGCSGEVREIVLTDNSVIVGEVVSLTNGVYTVKTSTLGTLKIDDSRIRTIGNKPGGVTSPQQGVGQQNLTGLTQKMLSDGSIMQQIQALQSDPEFTEILQDETIMRAISSGDFNALMANPKILNLMKKSSVQTITKTVQ